MNGQTDGRAFIETAERAVAEGIHADHLPLNVPRLKRYISIYDARITELQTLKKRAAALIEQGQRETH